MGIVFLLGDEPSSKGAHLSTERLPKGIRKVINLYGKRILETVGGWVDWDSPLGCAHFGCVWAIGNMDPQLNDPARGNAFQYTGRVLKISTDPTEGPVIQAIMNTGRDKFMAGLVRWEKVWRIPERLFEGPRGTAWVIIREEIRPYDFMHVTWNYRVNLWISALREYNVNAHRSIEFKRPNRKAIASENAQIALGELYNHQESYFVAEAIEELGRRDIVLADVHLGNLGFRVNPTDDQPLESVFWADQVMRPPLLIFDPGHSSAPPVEIMDLW